MKLSKWHDGNVKPVHDGVYERDYSFLQGREATYRYCKWEDNKWYCCHVFLENAINESFPSLALCPWRCIVK